MTSFHSLIVTIITLGSLLVGISGVVLYRQSTGVVMTPAKDVKENEDVYEDVRHKILELNEYGEYLKTELDQKHKELLFLYQMVREKEKTFQDKPEKTYVVQQEKENNAVQNVTQTLEKELKLSYNKKVLEMSLAGYTNQEIARKLDIETGQVELVLNLFK